MSWDQDWSRMALCMSYDTVCVHQNNNFHFLQPKTNDTFPLTSTFPVQSGKPGSRGTSQCLGKKLCSMNFSGHIRSTWNKFVQLSITFQFHNPTFQTCDQVLKLPFIQIASSVTSEQPLRQPLHLVAESIKMRWNKAEFFWILKFPFAMVAITSPILPPEWG